MYLTILSYLEELPAVMHCWTSEHLVPTISAPLWLPGTALPSDSSFVSPPLMTLQMALLCLSESVCADGIKDSYKLLVLPSTNAANFSIVTTDFGRRLLASYLILLIFSMRSDTVMVMVEINWPRNTIGNNYVWLLMIDCQTKHWSNFLTNTNCRHLAFLR